MFGLSTSELIVIMVIALIFIGPKKLPGLARGIGKGIKEFQDALKSSHVAEDIKEIRKNLSPEELMKTKDEDKLTQDEFELPKKTVARDTLNTPTMVFEKDEDRTDSLADASISEVDPEENKNKF